MPEWLMIVLGVGGYFALMRFVLPWLGVPT
jgi:hypothetical protein